VKDMQSHKSKPTKPLIMVVDDEEPLRGVLSRVLSANGFRVLVASTGNEALRICARMRRPIAVMITDLQLPGLSGFELAEEAARLRPAMPVLFMSGAFRGQDPEVSKCLGPGRDFLEKPFNLDSLAAKVDRILSAPQSA
jgi:DNA-binding response OmpR family regulator